MPITFLVSDAYSQKKEIFLNDFQVEEFRLCVLQKAEGKPMNDVAGRQFQFNMGQVATTEAQQQGRLLCKTPHFLS